MSNCDCHSDITIDGSGQLGRYLKALDPSYAPIDGRSIEDLLLFAKRYAGQVRFYDIPGSKINDGIKPEKVSWREFFRKDMAVIVSSIAVLRTDKIKIEYDELRERLDVEPSAEKYAALFNIIIGMAVRIDRWYSVAIPENPLRNELDLVINSHLKWQMKRIMSYEDGYKIIDNKNPLNLDYSGIVNDTIWGLNDPVVADISIYQGTSTDNKIKYASLYVDDIFNDFFSFLNSLIEKGPGFVSFALEQYPAHQPHMTLFITFLQLFKLAQEQMNGLTGKMLDFYYKDVLQLTPKNSVPDKTHIIFELAKDVVQYSITKDTALTAGKDAGNKEQVYKTSTELVVNQAKVKELKTIFIDKKNAVAPKTGKSIHNIFASPVANSADGYGTAFTDPNPKWPTFGKGLSANTASKNICKSVDAIKENLLSVGPVQTGFAIASPQLVLQGGKRLITLKVPGLKTLLATNLQSPLEVWLTGEKGWLKVDKIMSAANISIFKKYFIVGFDVFNPDDATDESSYYFDSVTESGITIDTLNVYLPIAEKPVIAFDAKLHTGYNYKTVYPVLQVMINEEMNIDESVYQTIKATKLSLEVRVGSINPNAEDRKKFHIPNFHFDGLETLVIQTAEGLFAPGKTFNPFSQYPGPGKSLYIGSAEVFNKPLNKLAVNILRTQQRIEQSQQTAVVLTAAAISSTVNEPFGVSIFSNRKWVEYKRLNTHDFFQVDLTENILTSQLGRTPIVETVTEWKKQVEKGFLRIDYLLPIATGNQTEMQASQALAPKLEVKELSVSYHSILTQLDSEIDQLFHVYPFGVVETFFGTIETIEKRRGNAKSAISAFTALDQQKNYLLVNANNLLLPQYSFLEEYSDYKNTSAAGTNLHKKDATAQNGVLAKLVLASSGIKAVTEGGNNQYSGTLQEQGMLFIGLEKAVPLQSLSLLFQFADGSAEDEDNDPPAIHWSYLTNNEWRPMRGEDIVADGTYGFQTTGILKINIPEDATANNTIITEGLHWLCASVKENAERIPKLINVVTQAVEVAFADNGNDQTHFDAALPAGSISKLVVAVPQVSKVQQPFASFDGKHKEVSKEFYTRVSERLRHKQRAINTWDYEHLVLDRFPSIYKVKCITHTDPNCLCRETSEGNDIKHQYKNYHLSATITEAETKAMIANINTELQGNEKLLVQLTIHSGIIIVLTDERLKGVKKNFAILFPGIDFGRFSFILTDKGELNSTDIDLYFPGEITCCGPQIAPGHVLLVPIANLKNRNSINPLQPKTGRRILLEIEDYLKSLTSPFVKVHAKNPVYEQVIVGFRVKFYTGTDKGYYLKKLNDEIVQYLTPWAFDENADVQFGQKIYASSIINFIEERPYVDFITDFLMGVCKDECCPEDTKKILPDYHRIDTKERVVMDKMEMKAFEGNVLFSSITAFASAPATAATIENIKGVVTDKNTGNPIPGASVQIKGTATGVITGADGSYSINADPATAVLSVKAVGYIAEDFNPAGNVKFNIALTPLITEIKPVTPSSKDDSVAAILAGICGCDGIEKLFSKGVANMGEIVAKPSTARSILVSVSQHVIILYEEPEKQTPCDIRKEQKAKDKTEIKPGTISIETSLPIKNIVPGDDKKIAVATADMIVENVKEQPVVKVKTGPGVITSKPVITSAPGVVKKPGKSVKSSAKTKPVPKTSKHPSSGKSKKRGK